AWTGSCAPQRGHVPEKCSTLYSERHCLKDRVKPAIRAIAAQGMCGGMMATAAPSTRKRSRVAAARPARSREDRREADMEPVVGAWLPRRMSRRRVCFIMLRGLRVALTRAAARLL